MAYRPVSKEEICAHQTQITNAPAGRPQPPFCADCGQPTQGKEVPCSSSSSSPC